MIKRANDITYLIDDMTSAEINVKLQSEDADEAGGENGDSHNQSNQNQFIENQYVKVFGILKQLQGQKCVQAFKIMPVKDLNEVTHHMLECMNASIYLASKANGGGADGGLASKMDNPNNSMKTSHSGGGGTSRGANTFGESLNEQV